MNWLEKYLNYKEIKDAEVWNVLRKELLYSHRLQKYVINPFKHLAISMKDQTEYIARKLVPSPVRYWLWTHRHHKLWPPVGRARIGSLRRVLPISREFGFDRGLPIDRYYIEGFLAANESDIMGRVLEIGDNIYTHQFGSGRVTQSDLLHVE